MRYSKILRVLGVALCFFFIGKGKVSAAGGPIVVEYYGVNTCNVDTSIQEQLIDVISEYQDVILVNCRMYIGRDNESIQYTREFCQKRALDYSHLLRIPGKTPLVVVNGRWDAVNKNIMSAVKMGRSVDHIEGFSVTRDGDLLNVMLPDGVKVEKGHLILYVYKVSEGLRYEVEQVDIPTQDGMSLPQSVPFVTSAEKDDLFLRPVMAMHKIGQWSGENKGLTFDLSEVVYEGHLKRSDIGYVVLLHKGGDYGPVLAAGEIMPLEEKVQSMPHSEPGYHDPDADLEIFKNLGQ